MAQAADCQQDEKTKSNANESVEDGLQTDAIYNVNEEAEAEEKGYDLEPDKRTPGAIRTCGLALINEFLQLAKILWPLFA